MINYKMKPGVVNVLISYVLKVNNQKFNKNYVDAIASQWSRLNIETVEEAMKIAEKEHNKIKKLVEKNKTTTKTNTDKKIENLPEWFGVELEKGQISKEQQEELDNLFKEFN